jgi:hypothetical protein
MPKLTHLIQRVQAPTCCFVNQITKAASPAPASAATPPTTTGTAIAAVRVGPRNFFLLGTLSPALKCTSEVPKFLKRNPIQYFQVLPSSLDGMPSLKQLSLEKRPGLRVWAHSSVCE